MRLITRFADYFHLRLHMLLILSGIILAAIIANKLLLEVLLPLERYPTVVVIAYLFLFLFVRLWLFYLRRFHLCDKRELLLERKASGELVLACFVAGICGVDDSHSFLVLMAASVTLGPVLYLLAAAPTVLSDIAGASFTVFGGQPAGHLNRGESWIGAFRKHTSALFLSSLVLSVLIALLMLLQCEHCNTLGEVLRQCYRR